MNLVKQMASCVKRKRWWNPSIVVTIAVSTGVDSMTLLYLVTHLRYCRPKIVVAHVNHELRTASWREERYLKRFCIRHHLKLRIAHWPVRDHPNHGVENAARQFRYRFFRQVMNREHSTVLLTAHHLNDQAETVLMRLIRGGDVNELTGIHRVRPFAGGRLIRPLLGLPKARLVKFAKRHQIRWFTDATNRSLAMTRNRMRHLFLPQMKRENPRILEHLGNYAHQLQILIRENRFLNLNLIKSLRIGQSKRWSLHKLLMNPRLIQFGIIKEWFAYYEPQLVVTPQTVSEVVQLLNDQSRPQGSVRLNHYKLLIKSYHWFGVRSVAEFQSKSKVNLLIQPNRWYLLRNKRIGLFSFPASKCGARNPGPVFFLSKTDLPLRLRTYRSSDQLRLKNGGHQKARRVLINQKVPNYRRKRALTLITHRGLVLALLGYQRAFIPRLNRKLKFILIIKNLKGAEL